MLFGVLSAMFTPWTLAASALTLLVYYAWTKTRLKHEGSNIPPFPAPAKPFLGHSLLLKGDILDNLAWMRKKTGDIYSLNLFGQHWIVVNGYENLKEVLVKHADKTQDRPLSLASKVLKEDNHGLITSTGRNFKEQRMITNTILRDFGMGKNIMAEKVALEVQTFIETLESYEEKPTDVHQIVSAAVCNIICSILVGHRSRRKCLRKSKRMLEPPARPPSQTCPKLRYLTAVIRETQRLAGVSPLGTRAVSQSFELQGYLIPEGSQLFINLNSALHDQSSWENPLQFRPERFLDANGDVLKPGEFLPFGLGRHNCVGEALARTELDLFLASMFQRFRFEPENPTQLPPLKGVLTINLSPQTFKVKFVGRNK
ncbi:hypothetical protein EGW08_003218 [Elysia chlorotica]|uniref:Uncharacterized protein n=1 Tax=Elysia chlorotica TaxID=188477 RepID=A0A3S0ZXD0_ELYCH|nr:hypothetical protein EGW08_003218 [Elysia chlorotica]